MSQENVEVVRAAFEAFGRSDWDALVGFLDPEIEWVPTGQFVGGQLYRGHAGVREFLDALGGEFEEFHAEPENFATASDVVVADTRVSGTGKRSGVPVSLGSPWSSPSAMGGDPGPQLSGEAGGPRSRRAVGPRR
jgi:ketosteroid isomerase-like protein